MEAEHREWFRAWGKTALLLAAFAALTIAASHLTYQYLRLGEGYARLILP